MPEFHLAGDHRRSTSSPTPELRPDAMAVLFSKSAAAKLSWLRHRTLAFTAATRAIPGEQAASSAATVLVHTLESSSEDLAAYLPKDHPVYLLRPHPRRAAKEPGSPPPSVCRVADSIRAPTPIWTGSPLLRCPVTEYATFGNEQQEPALSR
ncbi:uncharacterized protein [Aegilops tauschii subsp. strangulata]|uniref:uncharacterized protein isoform X2 n=1 Tax=Aegilops tauschii subsp. strangulata TaxID=200361 RepID=UPI001ABBF23D|nr:uncharacterized protein LOC109784183 isoform X3 [Aegilops tauschii subsp. strangulata]